MSLQAILVPPSFKKNLREQQITQDCSIQVDVSKGFSMQRGGVPLEQNKYFNNGQ